jgi:hypothetical protein
MVGCVGVAEHLSEHGVRVVCALMLDLSFALSRIGIALHGRCSNTFALSVRRQAGSDPTMKGMLDECRDADQRPCSIQASV